MRCELAVEGELSGPDLFEVLICDGKPALAVFGLEAGNGLGVLLAPTTDAYEKSFGLLTLVPSVPEALVMLLPVGSAISAGSGSPTGDIPIAATDCSADDAERRPLPF